LWLLAQTSALKVLQNQPPLDQKLTNNAKYNEKGKPLKTKSLQTMPNIMRRESHVTPKVQIEQFTHHCLPGFNARVEEIIGWKENKETVRHNACKIYCKNNRHGCVITMSRILFLNARK
jgi:hypothetical protein